MLCSIVTERVSTVTEEKSKEVKEVVDILSPIIDAVFDEIADKFEGGVSYAYTHPELTGLLTIAATMVYLSDRDRKAHK